MKVRSRSTRLKFFLLYFSVCIFGFGVATEEVFPAKIKDMLSISMLSYVTSIALLLLLFVLVLIETEIWKGFRHAWRSFRIKHKLKRGFLEAGFYKKTSSPSVVILPKILINFNDSFTRGTLRIENGIYLEKKLDANNISSALGEYVIDRSYLSDDQNYYVYEFYDSSIKLKLLFRSKEEFLRYSGKIGKYYLFIDAKTRIPIEHLLIVGQTGTGKTYALYSLILQIISKFIPYKLFIVDPKHSSLYTVSRKMGVPCADDIESTIELLESFVTELEQTKIDMVPDLEIKLDGDYRTFGRTPHILVFDEFASFMSSLQRCDKATRDRVNDLLSRIILQGRQLGFFLWVVMQKSDASVISTMYRDNLQFKVVLGNAEDTTYTTAFGPGVDIPNRNFAIGEGVYTEPTLSSKPVVCGFPTLGFDILKALSER